MSHFPSPIPNQFQGSSDDFDMVYMKKGIYVLIIAYCEKDQMIIFLYMIGIWYGNILSSQSIWLRFVGRE